jgi:Ca2+-binding EF-hand superfamily protein
MSLVEVQSAESQFKDSILQLQEIFTHFDKLGSEGPTSNLTVEKIGEALRAATGGMSFSEESLKDMVASIDLNASGDIQFNEFLKMMDAAKNDGALLHPRVTIQDLQEGYGVLGIDAALPLPLKDDDEHKGDAEEAVDPRPAMLAAARAQAESEYNMSRDDVKAIFQAFDTDHDGKISAAELQAMLQAQGEKYNEEEVHAMIHLVDQSNSGYISYQNFGKLMMSGGDD